MQAIIETIFDIAYLAAAISAGIAMCVKPEQNRGLRLFGIIVAVKSALPHIKKLLDEKNITRKFVMILQRQARFNMPEIQNKYAGLPDLTILIILRGGGYV